VVESVHFMHVDVCMHACRHRGMAMCVYLHVCTHLSNRKCFPRAH